MSQFQRGQKSKLDALTPSKILEVVVRLPAPSGSELDISCFGLDAQGKLSDDRYFVFFNQTNSPCGSVKQTGPAQGFDQVFQVDLSTLPASIHKLVFAATLDNGSMSQLGQGDFALRVNGSTVMSFPISGDMFGGEKAIMMAELYNKTVWRVAAVGQGFNGGLQALLEHFGGEAADPTPAAAAPAAPPPTPAPAPQPAKKVNLGKVTLEKRGQSQKVSLTKGGSGGGTVVHVNLNWDVKKKGGFFGIGGTSADLDLGCMFEMDDGLKGVIQPLGNSFGSRHAPPYIHLDQDDRSGSSTSGENMRIYRPDKIRRVVIFAMIYEGSSNFTEVNGRVTIKDGQGSEVLVRMDAPDHRNTFCAVCMIDRSGDGIRITKEERYFPSAYECDQHFGFGFRWKAGRK